MPVLLLIIHYYKSMLFTLVDVILIALLLVFVIAGFFLGLIQGVGALVGVVVGHWAAGQFYQPIAEWLTPVLLGHGTTANIIAFIFLFILINRVIAFAFYLINKIFKLASIIPFLGTINKTAGAILGLVEGVLIIGTILFVVAKFTADYEWAANLLNGSKVAHGLVWAASMIIALLPDTLHKVRSTI